ncbi:hypothetical protein [Cohnella thailandensis]|uniref:Glycosyltransferase RgtA/B/C/D-like domain-containing protein n=1 Tax=Cohnella thailandensis TaxID=557557 RepID=A0A841T7M0_9BACL|nr:hypothetical protein [Cohnella thailandensis]MBB6638258.1 hypothetical protein [Cohnella thailandensis]MBP1977680.1 hypothetical protein [Cohnella thailandensis]
MNRTDDDIRLAIGRIAALMASLLIVSLIMTSPIVGVADNGDFARVMGASGIAPLDPSESYGERYFRHAHSHYAYGTFLSGGYVSTHVLLVALSGLLSRLLLEPVYDIRCLGLLYTIAILFAILLLVRHMPELKTRKGTVLLSSAFSIALALVFLDIGYLAYFQSFFGEPYAMVAMLLMTAAALALTSSQAPSGKLLALFVCSALAVATAKIQYAPLGFVFAMLAWRLRDLQTSVRWRRQVRVGACLIAAGSIAMMIAAPNRLVHTNLYQSIFYGVLKDTPSIEADLKELGIPPKYAVLAGTNYFQKDTAIPQRDAALKREVLDRLSHRTIAMFYLKHPGRLLEKMKKAALAGTSIRPYYLGNYDKTDGKPKGALSYRFSAWSEFKHQRMPKSLGWFAIVYSGYMLVIGAGWLRSRSRSAKFAFETLAVVAACGIFAFVIPLIGDGEADLGKHLFLFNVCFDMMLVCLLFLGLYGLGKRLER